jgi:hypothetical protein
MNNADDVVIITAPNFANSVNRTIGLKAHSEDGARAASAAGAGRMSFISTAHDVAQVVAAITSQVVELFLIRRQSG